MLFGFPIIDRCWGVVDQESTVVQQPPSEVLFRRIYDGWRRPSETAAEQLQRRAAHHVDDGITANVIEGDEPDYWAV